MEIIILIAIAWIVFAVASGWARDIKESLENKRLREQLHEKSQALDERSNVLDEKDRALEQRDQAFKQDFLIGRNWLAQFVADAEARVDAARATILRTKSHPALKASEIVSEIKHEKREIQTKLKFLEYQLKSYEEYFPFLEEYRDLILEERIPLSASQNNLEEIEAADPVLSMLSRDEYIRLSVAERNQLALDRYSSRSKSNWEIGRHYERYLGYLKEVDGWRVIYQGALKGFDDFGRDLICTKNGKTEIVQAKCWSRTKQIREKHLFQLFGTCVHYRLDNPKSDVVGVFTTTTVLSEPAQLVAKLLQIRVEQTNLPKSYPMIKCNVNRSAKTKIYHLPFDQQYDRTGIENKNGDTYVATVKEAEKLGFRRAWKHHLGTESD